MINFKNCSMLMTVVVMSFFIIKFCFVYNGSNTEIEFRDLLGFVQKDISHDEGYTANLLRDIERGPFASEDSELAVIQFEEIESRDSLRFVQKGISHREIGKANIQRGIDRGLFTLDDYELAVIQFEEIESRDSLKIDGDRKTDSSRSLPSFGESVSERIAEACG